MNENVHRKFTIVFIRYYNIYIANSRKNQYNVQNGSYWKGAEKAMRFVSLIIWVTQFGFSAVFPTCFFLILASYLRNWYDLGVWVMVVAGILGLLTTISTVRSCVRAMRKEAEQAGSKKEPPIAYNDHD